MLFPVSGAVFYTDSFVPILQSSVHISVSQGSLPVTTSLRQIDIKKRLTYLKNRVTTNQKHTTDSQKPKRTEHKYNMKENHQTTKGYTKRNQRDKEEI